MNALALAETDARPSPKRRQMLDAAADLFIAQGYGAVSMDAIARAANVSKATLYAHFSSKDQLFATIIEDACRSNILDTSSLSAPSQSVHDALLSIATLLLRFVLEPRSLAIHRVVVAESIRFPELGRAFYDNGPARVRASLADWLAARVREGCLDISDPTVAADQLVSLVRGGLYLRASLGMATNHSEIESTAQAAIATFMQAFGPARGEPSAQRISDPIPCHSPAHSAAPGNS